MWHTRSCYSRYKHSEKSRMRKEPHNWNINETEHIPGQLCHRYSVTVYHYGKFIIKVIMEIVKLGTPGSASSLLAATFIKKMMIQTTRSGISRSCQLWIQIIFYFFRHTTKSLSIIHMQKRKKKKCQNCWNIKKIKKRAYFHMVVLQYCTKIVWRLTINTIRLYHYTYTILPYKFYH